MKQEVSETFSVVLFLIIHIHLQQPDEHPKQEAEELQVGASFPHLRNNNVISLTLQYVLILNLVLINDHFISLMNSPQYLSVDY